MAPPRVSFGRDGVRSELRLQPRVWRPMAPLGMVRVWAECEGGEGDESDVHLGGLGGASPAEADRFAVGHYLDCVADVRGCDVKQLMRKACRGAGVQLLRDVLRALGAWHFLAEAEAPALVECQRLLAALGEELAALPRAAFLHLLQHPRCVCARVLEHSRRGGARRQQCARRSAPLARRRARRLCWRSMARRDCDCCSWWRLPAWQTWGCPPRYWPPRSACWAGGSQAKRACRRAPRGSATSAGSCRPQRHCRKRPGGSAGLPRSFCSARSRRRSSGCARSTHLSGSACATFAPSVPVGSVTASAMPAP